MQDEDNDDGLGGRFRDRQAVTAANRWARPLAALDDVQLAALALPDWIADEVRTARALSAADNFLARERSLHRIDKLVRELEDDEIARIDAFLVDPEAPLRARAARIDAWRARLLRDGEPAIRALGEAVPAVDLQRLRPLVRALRKGDTGERPRRLLDEALSVLP